MLSNRPYLLRAFYQWIVDSKCNPILVLDANHPRCKIPKDFVEGDEIVFNISPTAVRDLKMANDVVEFKASFSGVIHIISAPVKAVLAVYAEENGEGIFFDAEEDDAEIVESPVPLSGMDNLIAAETLEQGIDAAQVKSKSKPFLTLVE
jgi:stringent starvation protein B